MDKFELEKRTKQFALKIIAFVATLPHTKSGAVIEYQLVKAGTSVGANYREANRAESRADFIHKIAIVEKEASESNYGSNCAKRRGLGTSKTEIGCCRNQENSLPFSQVLAEALRQTSPVNL